MNFGANFALISVIELRRLDIHGARSWIIDKLIIQIVESHIALKWMIMVRLDNNLAYATVVLVVVKCAHLCDDWSHNYEIKNNLCSQYFNYELINPFWNESPVYD